MIDFKRLFKYMKEPFEVFFKIAKKWITVVNIITLLVIIIGAVFIIGFLGLPIGIIIYLDDHYRLSNEILKGGILIETLWFFYWLYVLAKYTDIQVGLE